MTTPKTIFLLVLVCGCATSKSRVDERDRQSIDVSDSLIVDSKNVAIKNVLQTGSVLAGKSLYTEDVSDAFDVTVPVSDFVNPQKLVSGGAPIHIRIPKVPAATEKIRLAVIQKINASHLILTNATGVEIGNYANVGGTESTGTIVAKINGTMQANGTNTPVSGIALPTDNIFLNQEAAEQKASQLTDAPVLKAQAIDPSTGHNLPAWIPIPSKLVTQ